jgi:hypothetical protein
MYCSSHFETNLHDCPLIPIQNPYELKIFSENAGEHNISNNLSENQIHLKENLIGQTIKMQQSENIKENTEDIDKNPENLGKAVNENDVEVVDTEDVKNDEVAEDVEEEENEYEEFDVNIEGVYDLEHKHEDPDGYLKPIQFIDPLSPHAKSIKIIKNGSKECYFCGKPADGLTGGLFIKCRNIEEGILSGMKRGLFGGKIDGFWLCNNPDCSIKWKSKEPIYLTFKDGGKIYKFVSKDK